jgi:Ran GTPase-activating protein (RanGAP) involved in mRNA processing and transport
MQTLTTLDLKDNGVGAEGAQYLAQALHSNKVRELLF